jgi:glycosyltransferase involved in cell wall biosynthesis
VRKIAFVVQRYGKDVAGGAEEHCRQVAERLTDAFDVEVLTTCAKDYLTWENHFRPGTQKTAGVRVRRFPVARQRKVRAFGRFSKRIYDRPHTFAQEAEWMDRQGPDSPALLDFIKNKREDYDLFIFFTYLYPPTFHGLPIVADKAVLIPTAHDEAPIRLDLYRSLFHLPRGIIFNTDGERAFVHGRFHNDYIPWTIAGVGIDIPPAAAESPKEEYLLYLGRADVAKGCGELFDFFLRYKKSRPSPLKLLLAGEAKMRLPRSDDIVPLGFVSTAHRDALLAGARALVMPSRHESLSMVTLESWAAGTPVLVNGGSVVLADHIGRCGGGLPYRSFKEFCAALDGDFSSEERRRSMGRCGREYVEENYTWDRIRGIYVSFINSTIDGTQRGRESRD